MTPPRPIGEPLSIVAGDTLQFDRDFGNYPASDGWALTYVLGAPGLSNISDISGANITSTGTTFNINVPAATTAKWVPGRYFWRAYLVGSGSFNGQRFNVAQGEIRVLQNPSSQNAEIDTRSQAQINVDAIRLVLATRAGQDVSQYRIGHGMTGREFTKEATQDLLKHLAYWESIVRRERIANGELMNTTVVGAYFGAIK